MKFTTDKITWTESMKSFAEEQAVRKLSRVKDDIDNIEFRITKIDQESVKVAVMLNGYRAQAINEDFYIAVSEVLAKIKQLIIKDNKRPIVKDSLAGAFTEVEVEQLISKEKLFVLDSVTAEMAIERFEKTDYSFYVFKDIDCADTVSIIYRRSYDNKYGIIRCK